MRDVVCVDERKWWVGGWEEHVRESQCVDFRRSLAFDGCRSSVRKRGYSLRKRGYSMNPPTAPHVCTQLFIYKETVERHF